MTTKPTARAQQPWCKREDQFLVCPIPATYLAVGALSGRPVDGIRWRRRKLEIHYCPGFTTAFKPLRGKKPGRRRETLEDWPGVDWSLKLEDLQRITGLGQRTVWRLRREATAATSKPYRTGRRKYSYRDFPGVDWTAPTKELLRVTGVARPVVYRLRAEWKSATNANAILENGKANAILEIR